MRYVLRASVGESGCVSSGLVYGYWSERVNVVLNGLISSRLSLLSVVRENCFIVAKLKRIGIECGINSCIHSRCWPRSAVVGLYIALLVYWRKACVFRNVYVVWAATSIPATTTATTSRNLFCQFSCSTRKQKAVI